jgi:hypothetical protein
MDKKSVMSQFASVSEAALGKLAQSDLSKAALQGALTAKERVERLMSKMTDLDERVEKLEKRVAALEKSKRTTAAKKSRTSAAKKPAASTAKKTEISPNAPSEPAAS